MKRTVRLSAAALRDMSRLPDFLRLDSPRAATRARTVLLAALQSLEEFAERGRPTSGQDLRELVIPFGSSAYVAQYRIVGSVVLVARIYHGREDR